MRLLSSHASFALWMYVSMIGGICIGNLTANWLPEIFVTLLALTSMICAVIGVCDSYLVMKHHLGKRKNDDA